MAVVNQHDDVPAITSFCGEYRFLSNFWPTEVEMDGVLYPTVEHAYQAAKTTDERKREAILWQMVPILNGGEISWEKIGTSPGYAKSIARSFVLRDGWEILKLPLMEFLLRQKFSTEPLRSQLLSTYPRELVEGNYWGDRFWGVYKGAGENHLGKLLMKIRKEIRQEQRQA